MTDAEAAPVDLSHPRSAKRRAAAKKLRKLGAGDACGHLLDALRRELRDARTWETQYHMIMALGERGCVDALDELQEIAASRFEATAPYTALGDAITRLHEAKNGAGASYAVSLIEAEHHHPAQLIHGALRATALLRLVPAEADVARILNYGRGLPDVDMSATEHPAKWIATAAAGWKGAEVESFLRRAETARDDHVRRAASSALRGEYALWSVV